MANFYDQFRVQGDEHGASFIRLGHWHSYEATLYNTPGSNTTILQIGCRTFLNAAAARLHWRGGVSRDGGAPRPFAEALIALAEALCRINGWQGWAGPLLPHAMGLPQMTEPKAREQGSRQSDPSERPTIYSPEQQAVHRQLNELRTRVAELERKATSNGRSGGSHG